MGPELNSDLENKIAREKKKAFKKITDKPVISRVIGKVFTKTFQK